jgi:hypothetical protein
VDPWLDGALRFGGGYSNWLPAKDDDMSAVLDLVRGYSSAIAKLNAASGSPATCVFVPPRQMGDGCGCALPRPGPRIVSDEDRGAGMCDSCGRGREAKEPSNHALAREGGCAVITNGTPHEEAMRT